MKHSLDGCIKVSQDVLTVGLYHSQSGSEANFFNLLLLLLKFSIFLHVIRLAVDILLIY